MSRHASIAPLHPQSFARCCLNDGKGFRIEVILHAGVCETHGPAVTVGHVRLIPPAVVDDLFFLRLIPRGRTNSFLAMHGFLCPARQAAHFVPDNRKTFTRGPVDIVPRGRCPRSLRRMQTIRIPEHRRGLLVRIAKRVGWRRRAVNLAIFPMKGTLFNDGLYGPYRVD